MDKCSKHKDQRLPPKDLSDNYKGFKKNPSNYNHTFVFSISIYGSDFLFNATVHVAAASLVL